MKKSYCELCHNENCEDKGKRNIHFMGSNKCGSYISKAEVEKTKQEESKKNYTKKFKNLKDWTKDWSPFRDSNYDRED